VPTDYGPGIAVHESYENKQAELVYATGTLFLLGDAALRGSGRFQTSINNFQTTETLWVQLALPNALSIDASGSSRPNISAETPVELHHDVLVGIEPTPFESTSPGAVVTVMLWAVPSHGPT